ncbi:MAG: S9 family peptidase [Pseudomonadota bacterium]
MKCAFSRALCLALAMVASAFAADDLNPEQPKDEPVSIGLAGAERPDISRFLMARGAGSAKISPDGDRIAFISLVTGLRQIWTMPASGGQPRQLTFGNGVTFFEWHPNGKQVLYGADNNGNEQPAYYLISVDGASEREVLAAKPNAFRRFGSFSPSGEQFAYASTERNGDDFDIYVADIAAGTSDMIFQGKLGFEVAGWSLDGSTLIIAENVGEDSHNLYSLDVASGELTLLYKPEEPANLLSGFGGGSPIAFSPEGDGFYLTTNLNREYLTLAFHGFENSGLEAFEEPDGFDLEGPIVCGDRYLAYLENRGGDYSLKVQDLRRARNIDTPKLPAGWKRISCAREKANLLVSVSSHDTPGDLYTWRIGKSSAKKIYSASLAGLSPSIFVAPEKLEVTSSDGVTVHGLLYVPQGDVPSDGFPVLFDVHGGPTAQSTNRFEPDIQYHVSRGVAVLATNVRGSTGYGRSYLGLDNQEKRLDSVRDLVDILAALEEDPRIDASRAIVKGGSYGGYMVNAVLGAYPDKFIGGVSLYGVGNWVTALQIASPALKASDIIEYGDIKDEKWLQFYTENSPVTTADKISVPVLFSHGAQDRRIDKAETEIMVRALRKNGIDAPYILMPDEGHGWRKLKNRLFYYRREAAFLEQIFAAAAPEEKELPAEEIAADKAQDSSAESTEGETANAAGAPAAATDDLTQSN